MTNTLHTFFFCQTIRSNEQQSTETDLAKFKVTNACERCDLTGGNLRRADLGGANLRSAKLIYAKFGYADLTGTKYCKTKMPRGERNDDCEYAD